MTQPYQYPKALKQTLPIHLSLAPYAFFFAAAFALAAFFRLLRIMTTLRNEPTTAHPQRSRMTGIRIAHTRGGKKFWRG